MSREARRSLRWGSAAGAEVRQAARRLVRSPAFALGVSLTLALALGANTAAVTLIDRVLLHPLPYPESDRLVVVEHPVPGLRPGLTFAVSQAGYFTFRNEARSLEELGVYFTNTVTVFDGEAAHRTGAALVSAGFLRVLGSGVAEGRAFVEEDNLPGAAPVALLSHEYWIRAHGEDPDVVGRTLQVDGVPTEVVGVLPRGFGFAARSADVWLPLTLDPTADAVNSHYLTAVGRLAPEGGIERARSELAGLVAQFPERFPAAYPPSFMEGSGFGVRLVPLRNHVVGDAASTLWIVGGAVLLVLLVAAANVSNLFLVRVETRRRELALRRALGAGDGRILAQFLVESALIVAPAVLLGLLLGWVGVRAVLAMAPEAVPRAAEVRVSMATVGVIAVLGVAAGGVLTVVAWLRTIRSPARPATGTRLVSPSRGDHRVRKGLVVSQVALAVVLMAPAALLLRSVQNVHGVDPGFRAEGVLTADLSLPYQRYGSYEATTRFYRGLLERVGGLPGVVRAGAVTSLPLAGELGCSVVWTADGPPGPGEDPPCVGTPIAIPGFFESLGIPVEGRIPDWSDAETGTGAVVVTRALADRFWPRRDPIGQRLRPNGRGGSYYEVVGVVPELRASGLDRPADEIVWFPPVPMEGAPLWMPPNRASLTIQVAGGSTERLVAPLRAILTDLDPEAALGEVQSMEAVARSATAHRAFAAAVATVTAVMALLLSLVGLHATIAYVVAQRRRDMGIRMALGAAARDLVRGVVGQALGLAAVGVIVGLGAALGVTRLLEARLFEVSPTDPVLLAIVTVLVLGLAAASSLGPALRAARVDPAETLRADAS